MLVERTPLFPGLLRPLSREEHEDLRRSISEHGVLVAIKVDAATGKIVDGCHRWELGTEMGFDVPVEEVKGTEEELFDLAVELNASRRQMKLGEVREAWAQQRARRTEALRKLLETGMSVHQAARELGIGQVTAHKLSKAIEAEGGLPDHIIGEDGVKQPRRRPRADIEQRRGEAKRLHEEGVPHPEIAERLGVPVTTIKKDLTKVGATSRRELEERVSHRRAAVVRLVDEGKTTAEIATELDVSEAVIASDRGRLNALRANGLPLPAPTPTNGHQNGHKAVCGPFEDFPDLVPSVQSILDRLGAAVADLEQVAAASAAVGVDDVEATSSAVKRWTEVLQGLRLQSNGAQLALS